MSFSKCKKFPLQNLFQFCHFSLWTIRLNLDAPRRLQGVRFLNRSLFLLQFFNFFFIFFSIRFMLDAARLQRIRFSINSLRRASLFLAEPFSLIRLPLIVIPHPAILGRLKTIWNFNFPTSGPMSRTDQIVVTGLNDAWGPNYYFAVKLRQSLWLDIQPVLMKIHKSGN